MRILNHQMRYENTRTLPKLSQKRIGTFFEFARSACEIRCVLASLFLCVAPVYAQETPFTSSTISGLGARNIVSAAMSGRLEAIEAPRERSGKLTLFLEAA